MSFVAVLDIGKSKTSAGIFSLSGELVFQTGFPGRDLLWENSAELSEFLSRFPVNSLIAGVAGISRLTESWRNQLGSFCEIESIRDVVLVSDADFFSSALPPGSVGISIGTGSVTVLSGLEGSKNLFGGWGYLFGDELSGFWWFAQFFKKTLKYIEEGKPEDPVVLFFSTAFRCVPDRQNFLKAGYSFPVEELAALGSAALSEFGFSCVPEMEIRKAILSLLPPDLTLYHTLYLQGGLVLSNDRLKAELISVARNLNPDLSVQEIHSLLPGGFSCWKEKQF